MDDSQGRLLNVSLLAGSGAHRAYYDRSGSSVSELTADELASGFPPRPALNLRPRGPRHRMASAAPEASTVGSHH